MSADMGLGNPNISSLDKAAKVEKFNMNARAQVQYRFTFQTLSYLTYSIVIVRPLSSADPDLLPPNKTHRTKLGRQTEILVLIDN